MNVCLREILENTDLCTNVKIKCLKTNVVVYQNSVETYLKEKSNYDFANVIGLCVENNVLVFEVY